MLPHCSRLPSVAPLHLPTHPSIHPSIRPFNDRSSRQRVSAPRSADSSVLPLINGAVRSHDCAHTHKDALVGTRAAASRQTICGRPVAKTLGFICVCEVLAECRISQVSDSRPGRKLTTAVVIIFKRPYCTHLFVKIFIFHPRTLVKQHHTVNYPPPKNNSTQTVWMIVKK